MKTNSIQSPSTLIPEYIGSDFDAVLEVAANIEAIKLVAKTPEVLHASETKAGIAEIATQAEVNQKTNDSHIVTPKKLGTYAAPLVHNHNIATPTESGFLAATDKQKLDSIASSANNYIHPASGVAAGTYKSVTVNVNGHVTAGDNPTTLAGYGITDAVSSASRGVANGVATLDASGLVPSTQLPAYVDDVLEYANLAGFPTTGEASKIYVARDTNKTYRWSGTTYVYITSGAVDSVAGKTGVVTLVKGDVGLGNVDNTSDINKPVSTAQQTAINLKANLASPALTGTPTAPTAIAGTNTTQLATTEFVTTAVSGKANSSHVHAIADVSGLQTALNGKQAANADLTSITDLAGTSGFLKKTAANTWSLDTASYITGNQTITVSGDVSGTGTTAIPLTLENTGVPAGTYKSVTVDAKGRVTAGTNPTTLAGYGIADAVSSSHVGSAGPSHGVATTSVAGFMSAADKVKLDGISSSGEYIHPASGVTAGTYKSVTVDENGHITAGSNPTTLAGYGITDAVLSSDVVTTAAASKILKLDANSKLPASITGNADGNAATATKLVTARTINGVSFDGSADITINAVDSTSRIASSEKGVANGVATLGSDGKISSSQLPEYSASTVDSVAGKTGVVTLVKDDVGLSDVDNTSDLDKPISTAQQSVLNLKANLASPALTGTPSAPTATVGTSTTQIATTAFVNAEIANDAAPSTHVGATGTAHGVVTTTVNGFMSASDKTKLNGVATGATKNSTDAYLLNRANHTGTQATSTITGLDTTLSTINTSLTGKLDKAGGVISGPITEKIPTAIYTYTGDNITSITENYLGGVKTTSFQYTGDNITSMVEQYAGSTTTTTYVYDESGNLVSASSTYA